MKNQKPTLIRIIASVCLVAVCVAVGLLITYRVADTQQANYFGQRKVQAETAAAAIDADDVIELQGNAGDLETPAYSRIRAQLVRIKNSDSSIRFVYLMKPAGDKLVFLVDAEDPSSPDYSPPGEVYEETAASDIRDFMDKNAITQVEGPTRDRWGTWISASAYIVDGDSNRVALLGTDVDVDRALADFNSVKRFGTVFVVLASLLLALTALQFVIWRYNSDRRDALRLEMEASILKLNEELIKSDRMKSEFVQLVSHELRGPVNAVSIAVGMLGEKLAGKLDDDDEKLVGVAATGTRRLIELVNNLLDLTRIEAGDMVLVPEEVDLREPLARTVEMFQPLAAEKGLKMFLDLPEGDLTMEVDVQALLRVLENLVSNAIKFTDSGGITITVERGVRKMRFSVRDTGLGISDDFKDQVFKKFARDSTPAIMNERGAGMGLSLSKGLVEAMGGSIWFESRAGSGTTFFFEIPRRIESPVDEDQAESGESNPYSSEE